MNRFMVERIGRGHLLMTVPDLGREAAVMSRASHNDEKERNSSACFARCLVLSVFTCF